MARLKLNKYRYLDQYGKLIGYHIMINTDLFRRLLAEVSAERCEITLKEWISNFVKEIKLAQLSSTAFPGMLVELRHASGISQKELAVKSKVDQPTISEFESTMGREFDDADKQNFRDSLISLIEEKNKKIAP
jgi:hypothetical protein